MNFVKFLPGPKAAGGAGQNSAQQSLCADCDKSRRHSRHRSLYRIVKGRSLRAIIEKLSSLLDLSFL
jgi:hypothetical protein